MQKLLLLVLLLLLVGLQYKLWVGPGSLPDAWRLQQELDQQQKEIQALRDRNAQLEAEVLDLKAGLEAIEERARSELGMVGKDETFYRVVAPREDETDDQQTEVEHDTEDPDAPENDP